MTAAASLVGIALAPLGGCASSTVSVIGTGDAAMTTASLVIRVYSTSQQRREGTLATMPVTTRLVRYRGERTEEVRVATDPTWAISDLEPGEYGVSLAETDEIIPMPTTIRLRLRAGETASVDLVADPSPVARAARHTFQFVVAVTAFVAVMALEILSPP